MEITIKDLKRLVDGNFVKFDSFRQGFFTYILRVGDFEEYKDYYFIVPLNDIGTATMEAEDKAINFMRWIRKAIEDKTLIEVK